ncbi:MAG: Z1 domain-containing protein [Prevotella sp.]|jgi:heat shock protein HspQ|nr:Z1 domain-containing protein [Prevotella sp.]
MTQNDDFDKAVKVCKAIIGHKLTATEEEVNKSIKMASLVYPHVDRDRLKLNIQACYSTYVDDFEILEGKERRLPWLNEYKAQHKPSDWLFWNRYKQYLGEEKGFPPSVVDELDHLTDSVLDKLFDPTRDNVQVDKEGLVVGQVQSGKTANYTGLLCKAADAGFNLFIVLAGVHNNLRSQTQMRLDEGFLGFNTQSERTYSKDTGNKIGVGLYKGFENAVAHSITTSYDKGDFTKKAGDTLGINFDTKDPILLVVKKNASVLRRLLNWLKSNAHQGSILSKALLMIDDEADNASINTNKPDQDPTTINDHIRKILSLFKRRAYVGYTATPFANIFISQDNKDDLFPRDFIISLPSPTNYIGPDKVFGTSASYDSKSDFTLPIVNKISDYNEFVPTGHKQADPKPTFDQIPESLKTAIKCFIITCAVRILRGQGKKHNSMLIHVSRYKSWQQHIKELVSKLFSYYKQEIEADDPAFMEQMRNVYEKDSPKYLSYKTVTSMILDSEYKDIDNQMKVHPWEDVRPNLYAAVQKIEVRAINGTSGDVLDYAEHEDTGISVIAIGGDKLSRGLTLEGLSVSYFLRASKMYDTLMQMGRWFGYRTGYVDLCRLFTSSELNDWFCHITVASNELREEFTYLAESHSTPDQYALRVRTHPGLLQITAVNKMQSAQDVEVSWATRLVETYQLPMDRTLIHSNLEASEQFLLDIPGEAERPKDNYLWRNVDPDEVCNFLSGFHVAASLKTVDMSLICDYIRMLNEDGELTSWDVVLMNKASSKVLHTFRKNGVVAGCYNRTRSVEGDENSYYFKKSHIAGSREDEFLDLGEGLLQKALERTRQLKASQGRTWNYKFPSPAVVREEFRPSTIPLLILYPINPDYANPRDDKGNVLKRIFTEKDEPFIGILISFPNSSEHRYLKYKANRTVQDFLTTSDNFDEDNDNAYDQD